MLCVTAKIGRPCLTESGHKRRSRPARGISGLLEKADVLRGGGCRLPRGAASSRPPERKPRFSSGNDRVEMGCGTHLEILAASPYFHYVNEPSTECSFGQDCRAARNRKLGPGFSASKECSLCWAPRKGNGYMSCLVSGGRDAVASCTLYRTDFGRVGHCT